jgi:hypothetical protein
MSENEIKNWCRRHYNLRGNVKIRSVDIYKQQFTIRLGDCMADIPFPKSLVRELKLNMIVL